MNLIEEKSKFEATLKNENSHILEFSGVDNYDVYNCSQPFNWQGKTYLFGRVERRAEWMRSWVRLFEKQAGNRWSVVPDSMIYQLEDPYISVIGDELVLGGTHVRVKDSELDTFYGYFYKGKDINDLYYFTTGPEYMKDIRIVELNDGRIGVFSRPRGADILAKYGSESMIGFTIINSLSELTAETIQNAELLTGLFKDGEWGGCNQAYLLEDGCIGVLGHVSFQEEESGQSVYMNTSFVIEPNTLTISDYQLIGTRASYPQGPAKKANLKDCAFTSGLVPLTNGKYELYSGIGDTQEGCTTINYPFAGHGELVLKEIYSV